MRLKDWLNDVGEKFYAVGDRLKATEYVEFAKKALYAFPASDSRDALMFLPDYLISRDR